MKVLATVKSVTAIADYYSALVSVNCDKIKVDIPMKVSAYGREINVNVPYEIQNTLKLLDIELDLSLVKFTCGRAIIKGNQLRDKQYAEKRSQEYDASPILKDYEMIKTLLPDCAVGIVKKENFIKNSYPARCLTIQIDYSFKDSSGQAHSTMFRLEGKDTRDTSYRFEQDYRRVRGSFKKIENIVLYIKDRIESLKAAEESDIEHLKKREDNMLDAEVELGVELKRKNDDLLTFAQAQAKVNNQYYEDVKGIKFFRIKDHNGDVYYSIKEIMGEFSAEQMKQLIDVVKDAGMVQQYKEKA